jgi:hypothetical protein
MDPALGADGKLKPASELDFFETETDTVPISKGAGNVSKGSLRDILLTSALSANLFRTWTWSAQGRTESQDGGGPGC